MATFKAYVVEKDDAGYRATLKERTESDLGAGDVTVRVSHTTVNYKDGLAMTGKGPVVRRFPMIPGVDLAGVVTDSAHRDFKPGDAVILNGWGLGESHDGAYSEIARVWGDWLIPQPVGLDPAETMAIGTAGYTAMLCVMALERHAITPDRGPVIVTGAAGGVGSVAVALLARLGYRVVASTGRPAEAEYLKSLGADEVIARAELTGPVKALGRERWAGAVDSVGGATLANVISMTSAGGAVTACGLAGGTDLPAMVAPFILRGVSLLGINSVSMPNPIRLEAWKRLARDLDRQKLAAMTVTARFEDLPRLAEEILDGKIRGRVVIPVAAEGEQ